MKKPLIGIIGGKGKMGDFFLHFFERNKFEVIISDKRTQLSNKDVAQKADVVIVSVPISHTEEVIEEIAPLLKKDALLMDLTSIKTKAMEAMKKTSASYVGCHPLFGPTSSIHGQIVILSAGNGKSWYRWWKHLLEDNGVIVRELSAKKHDEMMSYIQTLTHFSHIVFADALRKSGISIKDFIRYPSPVYMMELYMMGRILNQDPKLYASIQISNQKNIKAISSYLASCRQLASTIEKQKCKDNINFFKKNAEYLSGFSQVAMEESDQLLKFLKLPQETSLFKRSLKIKKTDVAILGPENTFSDMAMQQFMKNENIWHTISIADIFSLVVNGKVKAGLVPIENSSTGSVRESLDELYEQNVHIEKVFQLPIHLIMVGTLKTSLKKVKTIYSHTQALLQCRKFIKKHCPNARVIPMSSTSSALERVLTEDKEGIVAIISPVALEHYNLIKIRSSIEDYKNNTTYFAYITKGNIQKEISVAKKVSIAFHFKKDSPGSLNKILQDFAHSHINLSKVESRPSGKKIGDYIFHIDFDGNLDDKNVKNVLESIKKKVEKLKIIGNY